MFETGKCASVIQKEMANELMDMGDSLHPNLYPSNVLRNAKSEYVQSMHLHKDVLTVLSMLKSKSLKNAIHMIGAHPVFVWYSSVNEKHIYQAYCKEEENPKIVIDATGSIVQKVTRLDGSISNRILLYACVIYWKGEQFSIFQMLSEVHNALHISNWLRYLVSLGIRPPKEIISDEGSALLVAEINVFTLFKTVTEYVNACFKNMYIPCYIRIDVAHFIHKYAILLSKSEQPMVKKFFLPAIGQLVLSETVEDAARILKHVLIVCQAKSRGSVGNKLTECSESIDRIRGMFSDGLKDDVISNEMKKPVEGKHLFCICLLHMR